MTNLEFIQNIHAVICVYNDQYFVKIPFSNFDSSSSYLDNYNNCLYIKLTDEFLGNDDLEYFINAKDETYEYYSNVDVVDIKSTNYQYYSIINEVLSTEFTEDEVLNAYQTFATILQDYANITDISIKTQIYKKIIEYFANGKTDDTITILNLLLGSSVYTYNGSPRISTCGCNSNIGTSDGSSTTPGISSDGSNLSNCADIYLNSILLYLKQMFGDIDFYNNFFFIDDEPNEEMINMLIDLLNKVLDLLNNGQNIYSTSTKYNHCICGELDNSLVDTSTYNIILNYIKVLEWVKNCEHCENTNKIKIYGEAFGEIFPNLYFV